MQSLAQHSESSTWNQHDTYWSLSLFGTAVGAGILFLPINLGLGGFWPLFIMAILAYPMTFYAHRGLTRFVLSSSQPNADFTDVVQEHFGRYAGRIIAWLYFLSIFPILLIYGVGITNTVESFLVHQVGMALPPRWLLSGALVGGMILIMLCGEKVMLRAFAVMVYPLAAILFMLSIYLIPQWHMPALDFPTSTVLLHTMWLSVPVIVFSFSFAAAVSSFAQKQRRHYQAQALDKSERILRRTSMALVLFVLFFVFSCILTLSAEQLLAAKQQNISILSYLANVTANPFIATLGPLVAFIAITSSFLGHFLGARESLTGLLIKHSKIGQSKAHHLSIVFLFITIWLTAIINPSILQIMEAISGPVIAMILFIMPVYGIYRVKALAKFRHSFSNYFVLLVGLIAVSALVYRLVM